MSGGAGGAGGVGGAGNGANGAGGVGAIGSGLTINNGGTIAGGLNGDGLTRANAITFTGGSNVLRFLNGTAGLNGNIGVTGALTFDQSGIDATIANVITGTGAVAKTGTAIVTLSGANTYSGGTSVNGGTLSISSDDNLGASSGGLTFDGGTLRITGGAYLASTRAITLNAGGGTFDIGGGATAFSQSFGGSGPVTFTNGVVGLAAVNTYSGTTTITSNGTLAAFAAGALSPNSDFIVNGVLLLNGFDNTIKSLSGSGDVANGIVATAAATLTIAPTSGVTTFSGTILDGTGAALPLSLTKTGAGTQVLSGINTYTGGTTIAGGTLSVSSDANLGAASGALTFDGGTLQKIGGVFSTARNILLNSGGGTLDFQNLFTSTGNLTGTGGLTVTDSLGGGGGTLSLSGNNTYSGATHVLQGSISAGSNTALSANSAYQLDGGTGLFIRGTIDATVGSLAGSGTVMLNDPFTFQAGNLTIGFDNTSTTFSGIIAGLGSLTKTGAGNLVLAGINTYTGATNVNAGTLSVNGSVASSSLTTVNPGGTLGGNGTVGDTAINGGTLAPGNSIGVLTVAGNLVLAAASTYMVEVSPAGSDFTHVTGTATLGGATVAAKFAAGSYVEKRYTILTADGGVNGTFSGPVNTNLPANFKTALAADGNNAYLDLALDYTPPPAPNFGNGLNQNQQAVATTLVNFFNSTGGIPLAFGALSPQGLTQVSGELATGTQQATFDAMNLFLGVMTDPFVAGRDGGIAPSGNALGYASSGNARPATERDAYAAMARKALPMTPSFEQRWSAWAAGYGGSQTTSGNSVVGSNTATSSLYGTAVGADYRISPDTLVGFAMSGGATQFRIANGLGSGRSDLFQAGAFIRHHIGNAYLSGALAYGWQDVTTDRTVTAGGIERLRANFNANAFSGRLEGGYRIATPLIGLTPYAAGQFTTYDLPAYAEQASTGSLFALNYAAKNVTSSRSELGLRTDKSFALNDAILTLRSRAAWAHNFDTDRSIAATFQSLPGASFVVNGAQQAREVALVTASAEMKWANGFALAATFEGEFSNTTTSYDGKGVVRYSW